MKAKGGNGGTKGQGTPSDSGMQCGAQRQAAEAGGGGGGVGGWEMSRWAVICDRG